MTKTDVLLGPKSEPRQPIRVILIACGKTNPHGSYSS
jgi:hypothetical protein